MKGCFMVNKQQLSQRSAFCTIHRFQTFLIGVLLAFLCCVVTLTLTSCGQSSRGSTNIHGQDTQQTSATKASDKTHVITDLAGRKVTLSKDIKRAAVLVYPTQEEVAMLGAHNQVAITGGKNLTKGWGSVVFPEYGKLHAAENGMKPNIEELIKLNVDVVFFWDSKPDIIAQIENAGIPVVVTQVDNDNIDTPEQFVEFKKHEIMMLGEIFGGQALDKAKKWCADADSRVKRIQTALSNVTPNQIPSVYYIRGPKALQVHGGESYTYYLVSLAKGDLVTKHEKKLLYTTTMEEVVKWNPSYIFMGRVNNIDLVMNDPAWQGIKAVKDKKVFVNLKGAFVADYSSDCFLLMEQIAQDLHPKELHDLDMVKEVQFYYKQFYNYDISAEDAKRVLTFKEPNA